MENQENENVTKLDLSNAKPVEAADDNVTKLDLRQTPEETVEPTVEENTVSEAEQTEPVVEVINQEEVSTVEEVSEEPKEVVEEPTSKLPENIEKLVSFMEETGGSIEDYLKLNRDIENISDNQALLEYYKETNPDLSKEEIDFLLEDQFSYDEDYDDEKDVMRRKLAMKQKVAEAKSYFEDKKSKYYEEIKSSAKVNPETTKAVEFFNRYNKEQEVAKTTAEKQRKAFDQMTDNLFTDDFKGFEYKIGDKTFRYNVKNAQEIKNTQSDINNFVKRFLAEDNTMSDAKGYHKSLYTAMNADNIAQHFYEQGKADALKDSIAKSKNVDMQPRQGLGEVKVGGTKFKILSGDSTAEFKVKLNKGRK